MKRYIKLILTMVLICTITACSQYEEQSNSITSDIKESFNSNMEEETVLSEEEQLQKLLNMITPITDYSLLRRVNDFYNIAIPATLSSDGEKATKELLEIQREINIILDVIVETEMLDGYGLQDNWNKLVGSCIALKNNLENAIEALKDNDSSRVIELNEIAGNTDIVEDAIPIQNVLYGKVTKIQENKEKQNIEVVCSYEECLKKATKYARYHFKNPDIVDEDLRGESIPVVIDDIPGKHYSFLYDNIIIFINVEDCSIVCRESIFGGYRDKYVNDGVLPAEGNDMAMPDIIGMDYEEAKSLLEGMGIQYNEGGGVDRDTVPNGSVAYCYPLPGKALTKETRVNIMKEIDIAN